MNDTTPNSQKTYPAPTDAQRKKAAQLVNDYNKKATALALSVIELVSLRRELGECGAGTVIVSACGWGGSALELIPMLKVEGSEYPKVSQAGTLLDLRKQSSFTHFSADKKADFAMPEGYTASVESLALHKAALNYAEQHGVDYITAAITIEKGIK